MDKYPNQLETPTAIIVFTEIKKENTTVKRELKGWKKIEIIERPREDQKLYFSHPQT